MADCVLLRDTGETLGGFWIDCLDCGGSLRNCVRLGAVPAQHRVKRAHAALSESVKIAPSRACYEWTRVRSEMRMVDASVKALPQPQPQQESKQADTERDISASPSPPSPDLYLTIRSANAQQLSAALLKVGGDATALDALSAPLIKGWLFEMRANVKPFDARIASWEFSNACFACALQMKSRSFSSCAISMAMRKVGVSLMSSCAPC